MSIVSIDLKAQKNLPWLLLFILPESFMAATLYPLSSLRSDKKLHLHTTRSSRTVVPWEVNQEFLANDKPNTSEFDSSQKRVEGTAMQAKHEGKLARFEPNHIFSNLDHLDLQ